MGNGLASSLARDPVGWVLFALTFTIYYVSSTGEGNIYNYHVLLADAIRHGRLDLGRNYTHLELVELEGRFYTVFPPGPALLLLPWVSLFGPKISQPLLSIFAGAASVFLSYHVLLKIFADRVSTRGARSAAIWGAVFFAFGSIHWYHAQLGSGWYVGQIAAIPFLWAAILLALWNKSFFWVGLCLGAAYLCRLPTIMAGVFFAACYFPRFIEGTWRRPRLNLVNAGVFAAGLLPALLVNLLYNYLRFGVVHDIAYDLLPIHHEPWYKHGLFNLRYVPIHLQEMFTALPHVQREWPYVIPSLYAMALWLVMPALPLALIAPFRGRVFWACGLAAIAAAIPGLVHGGNGFSQFGYRHTLDYFPFLIILAAAGASRAPRWVSMPLLALSMAVNLWGVVMISHLQKWRIEPNIPFYKL
ncbi:MAG TPA: hypothetical protein VFV50_05810 [Bdellovibrionales bacterium]|nr:hypothetical protein [Bdellovibrionales bacterium]